MAAVAVGAEGGASLPLVSWADVGAHNKEEDCWVVLHGHVWDLTAFLPEHPGGKKIIVKYAGRDATEEFDMLHDRKVIQKYGIKQGTIDDKGKLSK